MTIGIAEERTRAGQRIVGGEMYARKELHHDSNVGASRGGQPHLDPNEDELDEPVVMQSPTDGLCRVKEKT